MSEKPESGRNDPPGKESGSFDFRPAKDDETIPLDSALNRQNYGGEALIGQIVAGHYEILEVIGEGGMSVVYRARHQHLNRQVAIKFLHAHLVSSRNNLERFKQEARSVSQLEHRGVVRVYDFGLSKSGRPYIVMDLLKGRSLSQLIKDTIAETGAALAPSRALPIFIQIAEALAYTHNKGIVHRDLKPSNIIILDKAPGDTKEDEIRILDFGIAKLLPHAGTDGAALTQTGEVFGSPLYMSPEQCLGQPLDPRSDIYALGASLFEALTGVPPLSGETALETFKLKTSTRAPRLGAKVSLITFDDELEDLVADMLETDANHRPATAAHVVARLQAIRLMQEMGTPPPAPGKQTTHPNARNQEPTPRKAYPAQEEEEQAIEQSLTKKLFLPAVCLVGLAAMLCALAIWQYTAPNSDNPGKTKTSQMTEINFLGLPQTEPGNQTSSKPQEESTSKWSQLEKIPVICELNSAAAQKQFHLPQTLSIGSLRLLKNGRASEVIDVRGELRFPADAAITYTPNYLIMEHPEVMDKFKDGVLKELVLSNEELVTNDYLKHLTHLKSLTTVKLNNTMINDDGLKYLEQLPALDKLEIGTQGVRDKGLSQAGFLPQLRHLDLKGQPTISLTLKALAKSDKLQKLVATYCPLTREDWQNLARIKPLRELNLGSANLDDKYLEELVSLPNLQELEIKDCPVTTASVKILKRFPKLRFLVIDNETLTEQELQDFKEKLAPCQVARDRRSFVNFNRP